MKAQLIHWMIPFILLLSCKASKLGEKPGMEVRNQSKASMESVSFSLVNNYTEPVNVESTEHFFIQMKTEDDWKRIPFIPCACGVPCRPSASVALQPGGSIEISWNLISRRCRTDRDSGVVETIEEKVPSGEYQMVFTINRSENGMRMNAEKVEVAFTVK